MIQRGPRLKRKVLQHLEWKRKHQRKPRRTSQWDQSKTRKVWWRESRASTPRRRWSRHHTHTALRPSESESCSVRSDSLDLMDYTVCGVFRARILEWLAFPFFRGSSRHRDQVRVSHMQTDSFPAEPQGKLKNTGRGNLSLLQKLFLTQESNQSPALQADSLPTEL